jgi:hypothetical protein
VTRSKVSLLLSGKIDRGHGDVISREKIIDIFKEVCFCRQPLSKICPARQDKRLVYSVIILN